MFHFAVQDNVVAIFYKVIVHGNNINTTLILYISYIS